MRSTVLQFSGGKDSLACLYKWRDRLDDVTVLFSDTGAIFPHVRQFVIDACASLGADLVIVEPAEPIRSFHERLGVPADVVPVFSTVELAPYLTETEKRPLVNPVMRCCASMLLAPMQEFVDKARPQFVVRGSKKADRRVGVPDGHVENGITYLSPLWNMTDADVFAYLDEVGAKLPTHYATVNDSLDCYLCSGHLTFGTGAARVEYTRRQHPDLWPELERNLTVMRSAIGRELALVDEALHGN